MPIPNLDDNPTDAYESQAHAHPENWRPYERSRVHRIDQRHELPQELLYEISEAYDRVTPQDLEDCLFVVTRSSVQASIEPIFLVEKVFTSLEQANITAMDFFWDYYGTFFQGSGRQDRINFFWLGDEIAGSNGVGWWVDPDGELRLTAFNAEGDKFVVEVHARVLEW